MSYTYQPSDGASPDDFWGPKFLSNRDITGQAPIDKAVFPGIYLTKACFSDGVYNGDLFQTCFSNLLAIGFRRFVIDLYWSVGSQQFQLCPASIPQVANGTNEDAVTNSSQRSPQLLRRIELGLDRRQTETISDNSTSASTASEDASTSEVSTSTSSTESAQPTVSEDDDGMVTLGPYRCTEGLTVGAIVDVMHQYIDDSSDPQAATLQILEFNLNSASAASDPGGPPQNVTSQELPGDTASVGYTFWKDLGSQIYRPGDLISDRSNLNLSWYQVKSADRLPMTGYYNITKAADGVVSTDDGWPSELYLLLNSLQRVLLVWGTIGSEMEAYGLDNEASYVFPQGSMSAPREVQQSSTGTVTSGCFYSDNATSVSQVNNTWAMVTIAESSTALQSAFPRNITSCGIEPILNTTLDDISAADDYNPYRIYTESIVLGWAPGEPVNSSSPGVSDENDNDQFRCVVMDSSDAYRGSWKVVNCQGRYRAACRVDSQPFQWRLSNDEIIYSGAPDACPSGSSFDVPVTQLENRFLHEHVLNETSRRRISDNIWINLNSLSSENCWVTTGPNGDCRYQATADEERNRNVLIPTIAALIILILTVLTILVKCNVNRRNNRKHRIGPGGWEYEGVPS
jgi:hypothetical protein